MAKTYKKKQTRRRHRQRCQRASVRRIRKIQRGGADDAIKAIVEGIEISVVKKALIQVEIIVPPGNPTVTLTVEQTNTPPSNKISKTPVSLILDGKIDFFIVEPTSGSKLQSVYIYLNDNIYGRVMIVVNGNNMGSYDSLVATAIFNAINNKPDLQRYKIKL
jgi:hypothetical protein